MRNVAAVLAVLLASTVAVVTVSGVGEAKPQTGRAYYKTKHRDPVLEEMREAREKAREAAEEMTAAIRKSHKERDEADREQELSLTFDFEGVQVPRSPSVFSPAFHHPPTPQYMTGTCWSFSTTSFLESEVARLTGLRVKLSEMYTVYHEYLEKARRFVAERGDSYVAEGSETSAVTRIWEKYGAVPRVEYEGVLAEDGRFDHSGMMEELERFLAMVEAHDLWDETYVLGGVRLILDRHMGEPPAEVWWEGKPYTPKTYLSEVLKIDPADYVHVISTLRFPFYTHGEYEVPDNWWHSEDWLNLPLDVWYEVLREAAREGYTVALGGDVSEPGYQGFEDAAIVPEFDIPAEYINQDARELRFANGSSTDDHAVHLVGHTRIGKHDWFLIKDSARSSRWGKYEGYYFYRDDYVRLKMLSYTVHRDRVAHLLEEIEQAERKL